jgi:hypothetical protein
MKKNIIVAAGALVLWPIPVTVGLLAQTERAPKAPRVSVCEVVTDQGVVGDGGNNWGGHQTRIVRTPAGIFTAYTTGLSDPTWPRFRPYDGSPRFWKLAQRTANGWKVIAEGRSGREPVNLMAGPNGSLHVVAWPDAKPHLWSGQPHDGTIAMKDEAIPGSWENSNWPYNSAGISSTGDIALVQSAGEVPGRLFWGYLSATSHQWTTRVTVTKERHCYTYVLPEAGGRLAFTSTRDVPTEAMGYAQSATSHLLGFVFNRSGLWETDDVATKPMNEIQIAEAVPTREFPEVAANGACVDTYRDTRGRMHVLYFFMGPETKGKQHLRHSIVERGVVRTVELPEATEPCFTLPDAPEPKRPQFCRIFQDAAGRFYLLGTTAIIPADAEDGTKLGKPVPLDLDGHAVEYSGISIAVPRGGTPPADFVDGVFPTDQGRKVVYLRIQL